MFDRFRTSVGRFVKSQRAEAAQGGKTAQRGERRTHNLFEAAAAYVSACAEDDQDRMDEAVAWVSPEALSFGVSELACRAVIALARERDESPRTVARTLLGLPTL
ncbi:hypothetical protein ACFOZ0_18300 [Streptomyces yaanensis]|uniref:Uncharacterized protein n=1 Tax=Streptomyces yaanensis TaxID=1142239 RepID=A0ABV7SE35_9ACTN|nr:hypothetical protein [Streptomyces sp. CGMCC 4.7035]WNB99371.1 hypothetical protein Q2K21_15515 [Streptomyces sp. CGMCC 4.7035]